MFCDRLNNVSVGCANPLVTPVDISHVPLKISFNCASTLITSRLIVVIFVILKRLLYESNYSTDLTLIVFFTL